MPIAEMKYAKENFTLVFIFDQSSGHTPYTEDVLNVQRMTISQMEAIRQNRGTQFGMTESSQ